MRMDPSDETLLLDSLSDLDAFGAFYDRHATGVLKYFYARVACAQTAADLTSETFAAALVARGRYKPSGAGSAKAWLYGIARHQLLHWFRWKRIDERARHRLKVPRIALDDSSLEWIEDSIDLRADLARMEAALDGLTEGTRRAVLMRVVDQRPYEEIATRLHCTPATARVRVARGLESLRKLMDGGDER